KGSAILGCVGCLVGHLFMFLVGGKTPDQSVHLNLTTTLDWINLLSKRHPASLERHVRTMIKAVQRLHRRDDTELQRGQQGLSLAA
ncbi:hypothetical protein, partial [Klebsiella variicola]